ncbi:YgiT-type zinc finger protein [Paenibacillus sp. RUD330]|uniref:YgiT-type zinc finger protein n=1 Tax=Paenibacillus sp. RUD330 TaxID=2023772 RepID=UPI000B9286EE|nr:YgiT-type zinc finger protein [Paenibacillus sp. RUD330]ASS66988.1 YgiT-type zinc finger protein [Paenibacillus sp. RUD330]
MESICTCGKTKEFRVGSNELFVGTRKIVIHNIPHYFCSQCNKESYDSKLPVDAALKYAYKNNVAEFNWEEYKAYASAYEKAFEIGILMVVRRMADSGMQMEEVAKYTDYSPGELERLLEDEADLIKERMQYHIHASAFEREWHRQMKEASDQTIEGRLSKIKARIQVFQSQYGDTYENCFGHLADDFEIDAHPEAVDIFDWRDLEKEKDRIELALEDDFQDGVFAIPSSSKVKVRALFNYCKQVGKEPSELSADELEQFMEE